jgi:hypothetical protein
MISHINNKQCKTYNVQFMLYIFLGCHVVRTGVLAGVVDQAIHFGAGVIDGTLAASQVDPAGVASGFSAVYAATPEYLAKIGEHELYPVGSS